MNKVTKAVFPVAGMGTRFLRNPGLFGEQF